MSMDYVRRMYGVPAKRGGRVAYLGLVGVITSARFYVYVRFAGEKRALPFHPLTDGMKYLTDNPKEK